MEEEFERLSSLIKHHNKTDLAAALEEIETSQIDYQEAHTGNTLLHIAAQTGSKFMVKNLLRRGAQLNLTNNRGNTAVHFCFKYKYEELGEYLISKGADDSITNADGLLCREMLPGLV
jgi:ankyrin repeat protein